MDFPVTLENFSTRARLFRAKHREVLLSQDPREYEELTKEAAPLAAFAKLPIDQFLRRMATRCLDDK